MCDLAVGWALARLIHRGRAKAHPTTFLPWAGDIAAIEDHRRRHVARQPQADCSVRSYCIAVRPAGSGTRIRLWGSKELRKLSAKSHFPLSHMRAISFTINERMKNPPATPMVAQRSRPQEETIGS